MIVCHCEAVSDRTIDRHVAAGCTSLGDLARRCGAGTGCGVCAVELRRRLERAQRAEAAPRNGLATSVAAK